MPLKKKHIQKNRAQDHADRKLSRTILINFVFSTLCSLHYALCAATFVFRGFFAWWSILDFLVSSICLFLMLASNRRFLVHMMCCSRKCADKCIKPPTFLNEKQIEEAKKEKEQRKSTLSPNDASPPQSPRWKKNTLTLTNLPSNTNNSPPPPSLSPNNISLNVSETTLYKERQVWLLTIALFYLSSISCKHENKNVDGYGVTNINVMFKTIESCF